jgi:hypothetical protein
MGRRPTGRPPTHALRRLERGWRNHNLDENTIKITRDLMRAIAADAGGMENQTTRELFLIEDAAFAKFIVRQGMDHIIRSGSILDEHGDFHPILGRYLLAWMNTLRLNLVALGLRPDAAEKVEDLASYLARKQAESRANSA